MFDFFLFKYSNIGLLWSNIKKIIQNYIYKQNMDEKP